MCRKTRSPAPHPREANSEAVSPGATEQSWGSPLPGLVGSAPWQSGSAGTCGLPLPASSPSRSRCSRRMPGQGCVTRRHRTAQERPRASSISPGCAVDRPQVSAVSLRDERASIAQRIEAARVARPQPNTRYAQGCDRDGKRRNCAHRANTQSDSLSRRTADRALRGDHGIHADLWAAKIVDLCRYFAPRRQIRSHLEGGDGYSGHGTRAG